MISSLRGPVIDLGQNYAVLDIGGVGMRAEVTQSCALALRVGDPAQLFTQLVVREDSLTLFGFETQDELEMFNLLTSVSGVGPRSALGILSSISPSQIVEAVRHEQEQQFKQVSGIGPKSAKLIIVSLQGKLEHFVTSGEVPVLQDSQLSIQHTVVQALIGLGWSESAAQEAVQSAHRAGIDESEAELLRSSLILLQNVPGRS